MESFKIENLTFSYPGKDIPGIKNINLSVKKGEFITICGKSGSGKSTLLRHLKPGITPSGSASGSIFFEGKEISSLKDEEKATKIGFVMQNPENQIVTDKVWHELAFGLESLSKKSSEIRVKVAETASYFGIQTWFNKKTTELSGGQKQLLNLASVMVMEPSVLLLDEPTSQLDPITALEFIGTLKRINTDFGTTIIISEHRLEDVFPVSDRVVVLENGEIIADASPRETAKILKNTQNDMVLALPTAVRIYSALAKEGDAPLTIREGRDWLFEFSKNNNFIKDVNFCGKEIAKDAIIELSDVWFRYEKNAPDVLKGLSIKINKGEFFSIVGGNGAGKTTALSIISGNYRPYSGKIHINHDLRIATLPQNPQALFVKNTVKLDFIDVLATDDSDNQYKAEQIKAVCDLCEIGSLLHSHPYDLSGGEMQRAALAKLLLYKPDVLLLDEPTKGLDAHFKTKLAGILKSLCERGITIIIVSHDLEFCAKHSDKTAMFFDGSVISENNSREFFAGNTYYTTGANRMARDVIKNAVTDDDVVSCFGGKINESHKTQSISDLDVVLNALQTKTEKKTLPVKRMVWGIIFALMFFLTEILFYNKFSGYKEYMVQFASLVLAFSSVLCFFPARQKEIEINAPDFKEKKGKNVALLLLTLLTIILTILFGIYFLNDRKYLAVSLLIILEVCIPFVFSFERRKHSAGELVIISALCAIAVVARAAFCVVPQFKPLIALVIISAICLGGEYGFLIGAVSAFASNFFFGQGPWTPWQMLSLGLIGFIFGALYKNIKMPKSKAVLSLLGGLSAIVIYGLIMNFASVVIWQSTPNKEMIISAYAFGLPYDILHGISTTLFLWFVSAPLCEKINRIKTKYGFFNDKK